MATDLGQDLPPYWRKRESRKTPGEFYYVNVRTKVSQWMHPGETKIESNESSKQPKPNNDKPKPTFTPGKWHPAEDANPKRKLNAESEKVKDKVDMFESTTTHMILQAKRRLVPNHNKVFTKADESDQPPSMSASDSNVSNPLDEAPPTKKKRNDSIAKEHVARPQTGKDLAPAAKPREYCLESSNAKKTKQQRKRQRKKERKKAQASSKQHTGDGHNESRHASKYTNASVRVTEPERINGSTAKRKRKKKLKEYATSSDKAGTDKESVTSSDKTSTDSESASRPKAQSTRFVIPKRTASPSAMVPRPVLVAPPVRSTQQFSQRAGTVNARTVPVSPLTPSPRITTPNKTGLALARGGFSGNVRVEQTNARADPAGSQPVSNHSECYQRKPPHQGGNVTHKLGEEHCLTRGKGRTTDLRLRISARRSTTSSGSPSPQTVFKGPVVGNDTVKDKSERWQNDVGMDVSDSDNAVIHRTQPSNVQAPCPPLSGDTRRVVLASTSTPCSAIETDMDVDVVVFHDLMSVRQRSPTTMPEVQVPGGLIDVASNTQPTASPSDTSEQTKMYIILDTNILMHDIKFVDDVKDQSLPGVGRPMLIVPWVVIQELDGLKNGKTGTTSALRTQLLARHPVNYLNQCLQAGHPRIAGQTPAQDRAGGKAHRLTVECNDDRVLVCCLQFMMKSPSASVLLLTLDKNLRNKAIITGIQSRTIKTFQEEFGCMTAVPGKKVANKCDDKAQAQEKLADEIMCELKVLLRDTFSVVMEKELMAVYDDIWLSIVFRKPPWTLYDLLECFNKHWIAVFGIFIQRNKKMHLEALMKHFKPGSYNRSIALLKDVVWESGSFVLALRSPRPNISALNTANAQLTLLYKIVTDVLNNTQQAGPLSTLLQLYAEPGQDPTKSPVPDVTKNWVQDAFQVAWESIVFCGDHLRGNIFKCDAARRMEYVTFFGRLAATLQAVNAAYVNMLAIPVPEAAHHEATFITMSNALDQLAQEAYIQPWARLDPAMLHAYYVTPGNHTVLENGHQQLKQLLQGFDECFSELNPSEQLQVQPVRT